MLENILKTMITQDGPMDIGQYMNVCLAHPEYGYYTSQNPLGASGDFTTAPEISQMFGEMIGAWLADIWIQMGSSQCHLVELGPGHGTLMADILRATKHVPGFHDAMCVHLVEIGSVLKQKQQAKLTGYDVTWHAHLEDVPTDRPILLVANEFLDALPMRQMMWFDGAWQERVIGIDEQSGALSFGVSSSDPAMQAMALEKAGQGNDFDILELAPVREVAFDGVCKVLKNQGGAALFIDYGYTKFGLGDTLQAIQKHDMVSPLHEPGLSDLTSHVDFCDLSMIAKNKGVDIQGLTSQGEFLKALGIEMRAQALSKHASADQKKDIEQALNRLVKSDQMGELFKVLGVSYGYHIHAGGFTGGT